MNGGMCVRDVLNIFPPFMILFMHPLEFSLGGVDMSYIDGFKY